MASGARGPRRSSRSLFSATDWSSARMCLRDSTPARGLHASAEAAQLAPVALGRAAFARALEVRRVAAFLGNFAASLAALLGLAVQQLRHGGGPAHFAQAEDVDDERGGPDLNL